MLKLLSIGDIFDLHNVDFTKKPFCFVSLILRGIYKIATEWCGHISDSNKTDGWKTSGWNQMIESKLAKTDFVYYILLKNEKIKKKRSHTSSSHNESKKPIFALWMSYVNHSHVVHSHLNLRWQRFQVRNCSSQQASQPAIQPALMLNMLVCIILQWFQSMALIYTVKLYQMVVRHKRSGHNSLF